MDPAERPSLRSPLLAWERPLVPLPSPLASWPRPSSSQASRLASLLVSLAPEVQTLLLPVTPVSPFVVQVWSLSPALAWLESVPQASPVSAQPVWTAFVRPV